MKIAFAELKRQYSCFQEEYEMATLRVLRSGWYILGNELLNFEKEFANYQESKYAIGVGNGLDALTLALKSLGIGAGDEVIVPANTFIATALAVSKVGAQPVFVDVDDYFGIQCKNLNKYVTSKTKAIIPVHLYGQPCDMDAVMMFANNNEIEVIEDCSQAHGAKYKGKKVGSFGKLACYSLYPMKPIGAFGDAGVIVTNDDCIAEKIKKLRNYGCEKKYYHELDGINSRMDEIQAAIALINLNHVNDGLMSRKRIASKYSQEINNKNVIIPKVREECENVYHVFPILCDDRDEMQMFLEEKGIATQIHYPIPCHLAECYCNSDSKKNILEKAEYYSKHELSLPIYFGLTDKEVDYIISTINKF